MERQVARYSYWIGLGCVAIAMIWRAAIAIWAAIPENLGLLWFSSFWKAGALLLLVSIASANYAWLQEQKVEKRTERTGRAA